MTFKSFKGRAVEEKQRVKVYRNLHNGKWSIADKATGLVLGHADSVILLNAEFIVKEAGRQRVLREKQKNVHAVVEGNFLTADSKHARHHGVGVTYNPYKYATFVDKDTEEPIFQAAMVTFTFGRVFATTVL